MSVYFERTTVTNGGRPSRGFKIQCGHCKFNGAIPVEGNLSAEHEVRLIRRKFEGIGWKVGKIQTQHRCPRCYSAIKNAAIAKSQKVQESNMEALSIVPPREMQREDKRIIFAKIHEVYGDNSYLDNWTDAKIASDLGVPRAWVKSVREAEFGAEGGNEEIKAALAEAGKLLADVRAVAPRAEEIVGDVKRLLGAAEKVQKTISEIERGLR